MLSMTSSERSFGDGPMDVRGPATRSIATIGAARGTAGTRSNRLPLRGSRSSKERTVAILCLDVMYSKRPVAHDAEKVSFTSRQP